MVSTLIPFTAGAASAAQAAPDAPGSIVFSGAPGTSAPPATLGAYAMAPFGADDQPVGGSVTAVTGPSGSLGFTPSLTHDQIGRGWATWSNGYTGDVYSTGSTTITLALPASTEAFYFYAEPDQFASFTINATNSDGTSSGDIPVNGSAGAQYFGFYSTDTTPLTSITVTTADTTGFAVGEFGVATKPTAPAFTRESPPLTALTGSVYSASFAATGAPAYALASAPSWLSIDPSGAVTGTPPSGTTSFSYSVTATNALGSATAGPYTVATGAATTVAGTVVGEGAGAGPVVGATVQACTAGASQCQRTTTAADGTFSLPAPVGASVVLTAFPLPGSGGVPTTTDPIAVPAAGIQGESIALSGIVSLPAGLQVNGSVSPTLYWGSPSPVTLTGCPNGTAFVTVEGQNIDTGLRQTDVIPLTESPAGSGSYTGTIPAQAPVHGPVAIGDKVLCPSDMQSAVQPFLGAAGTSVLISGTGFTAATAVTFGSVPATSFTVVSDTLITAVAPTGQGDAAVTVTTPAGPAVLSGPNLFSYFGVAGVSPATGPAAGGSTIVITGAGFSHANSVTFGTAEATSFQIISDTQIQAVTPPGTGAVDVAVTDAGTYGAATATSAFTFAGSTSALAQPVRSATPTKPAVAGSATLTTAAQPRVSVSPHIAGIDIHAVASQLVASLGDKIKQTAQQYANDAVAKVPQSDLCNSKFDKNFFKEQIHGALSKGLGAAAILALLAIARANAPAIIGGALWLTVTAGPLALTALVILWAVVSYEIGVWFNAMLDTYLDPLLDNAIDQRCGGNPAAPPLANPTAYIDPSGTVLDTSGNPVNGATVTLLRADTAAGPFTTLDPAGPGIEPAVNPQSTGADGVFHWDVFSGWYEIQATAPGCTDPNTGQSAVTIGPYPVPPPQVGLTISMACAGQAPPPTPTVTSLSTGTGPTAGGTTVSVYGTGFTPSSTVDFGTSAATAVTYLSTQQLTVTTPAGIGPVDVTVHNGTAGSATSTADQFFFGSTPVVTALSATSGPISGGTTVTITGTGFTGAQSVTFGGLPAASFSVVSDTQIQATTPTGPIGSADVQVVTPAGTSAPTTADQFTFTPLGPGIDQQATATGTTTVTAHLTTTAPGDLIVAFVAGDGPATAGQRAKVSGGKLTWTLAKRTNSQRGTAEIWTARATGALSNAAITATLANTSGYGEALTVVAFSHAQGVGQAVSAAAHTGAPSVTLTTSAANAWVLAVGNDWTASVPRAPAQGQTLLSESTDARGDTYWVQYLTAPIPTSGTTATINDTAPTNDRWNLTEVEID